MTCMLSQLTALSRLLSTYAVEAIFEEKPLADSAICTHREEGLHLLFPHRAHLLLGPPELPHWPQVSVGTLPTQST